MGFDYIHRVVDDHSRLACSEIHADEKPPQLDGGIGWRREPLCGHLARVPAARGGAVVLAFFRELTEAAIDLMGGHIVRTPSAETISCVGFAALAG